MPECGALPTPLHLAAKGPWPTENHLVRTHGGNGRMEWTFLAWVLTRRRASGRMRCSVVDSARPQGPSTFAGGSYQEKALEGAFADAVGADRGQIEDADIRDFTMLARSAIPQAKLALNERSSPSDVPARSIWVAALFLPGQQTRLEEGGTSTPLYASTGSNPRVGPVKSTLGPFPRWVDRQSGEHVSSIVGLATRVEHASHTTHALIANSCTPVACVHLARASRHSCRELSMPLQCCYSPVVQHRNRTAGSSIPHPLGVGVSSPSSSSQGARPRVGGAAGLTSGAGQSNTESGCCGQPRTWIRFDAGRGFAGLLIPFARVESRTTSNTSDGCALYTRYSGRSPHCRPSLGPSRGKETRPPSAWTRVGVVYGAQGVEESVAPGAVSACPSPT